MKLSKREKVLIFILIIAVIGYAAYKFLPSTELFNLDALKEENNQKSELYDTMSQNILLKSKYEEQVQTLSDEINNLNVISDIQQENIIVFLNNYFTNNNIDANNISFTDATVIPMSHIAVPGEPKVKSSLETIMGDINGEPSNRTAANETADDTKPEQAAAPQEEASQQPTLTARSISVNIAFESTYGDMIKFIDSIQNNAVDISITNVNTVSPGGDVLQGTMTLNFYGVPKLEGFAEQNLEWTWKDLNQSGKSNPFSSDSITQVTSAVGSKYDFFMSLQPESSDLPTVLIGKTEDSSRKTYVSEENNSIVSVEFNFKTENDKYYYSYSTKNSSFPKKDTWQEFTPTSLENIYIKVSSSERSSKTDSVGANIGVINTSGLKVRFDIEDDDKNNPRVYFKDAKTVTVTRK